MRKFSPVDCDDDRMWREIKRDIFREKYKQKPSFVKLAWKYAKMEVYAFAVGLPTAVGAAYGSVVSKTPEDILFGVVLFLSLFSMGAMGLSAKFKIEAARSDLIEPTRTPLPKVPQLRPGSVPRIY